MLYFSYMFSILFILKSSAYVIKVLLENNLLSSIKGEKFYNDKVICASQGYAYKTRQEKEKKSDLKKELLIQTFPNPAIDILTIKLSQKISGDILVSLNDIVGRTFIAERITELFSSELDLKDIPQGFYILSIQNNNESIFNSKVYVQK
jgi:hypothetical protein